MHIVHTIAHKLKFQVLVISHHDLDLFREHADRIYTLRPSSGREFFITVDRVDPPEPRNERFTDDV
ncbi:MAG: hypothetical protein ACUVWY_05870 [Desulfosoma sp.]|uniref:hypothetical protein n=1 Tax=Desulfosoma sp. TaxID=2603217 RepID=UPI0040497AA1